MYLARSKMQILLLSISLPWLWRNP